MRQLSALLGALLVVPAFGCSKKPPPSPALPTASAAPATTARPSAPASALPPPMEPAPRPACRAAQLTGTVRSGTATLKAGELLDGDSWLDLEAGAELSLKHTLSGRELQVHGPARVLVCRNGREQFLLARGRLTTFAGLGARPGAEVLIATPVGTLRYGDAALDVDARALSLRVVVHKGEASVLPESNSPTPFHNPLRGPADKVELRVRAVEPSALVDTCQKAAQHAEESARKVIDRNAADAGSLGTRAATHVRDRAAARAACATAAAAVGLVKDPAEGQTLSALLRRWDGLWQSVPPSPPVR